MGNDTTNWQHQKGLLTRGALHSEPACWFLDTRQKLSCLCMSERDPRAESSPALPQRGSHSLCLSRVPGGCPTPKLAACHLLLQHSCMGSWTNRKSWAITRKRLILLIYAASSQRLTAPPFKAFTRKCHCLQYKAKSAELVNVFATTSF